MMRSIVRLLIVGVASALAVWMFGLTSVSAHAASCSVNSNTPLIFGAYNPFGTKPVDSVGNINYTCTAKVSMQVSLSGMLSNQTRKMTSSKDTLLYNVYTDAARSVLFGDGTFGASPLNVGSIKKNTATTTSFYGRISAGQDIFPGTYSASLVVTLNFQP